eukprot:6076284-Prymnesium_polylepis.3
MAARADRGDGCQVGEGTAQLCSHLPDAASAGVLPGLWRNVPQLGRGRGAPCRARAGRRDTRATARTTRQGSHHDNPWCAQPLGDPLLACGGRIPPGSQGARAANLRARPECSRRCGARVPTAARERAVDDGRPLARGAGALRAGSPAHRLAARGAEHQPRVCGAVHRLCRAGASELPQHDAAGSDE